MARSINREDYSGRSTEELISAQIQLVDSGVDFAGFIFMPKDFLSDSRVSAMPMESRGAHITLMATAWSSSPPCSVSEEDMEIVIDSCMNPEVAKRWLSRAWEHHDGRFWQRGLLKTLLAATAVNVCKGWGPAGEARRGELRPIFDVLGMSTPDQGAPRVMKSLQESSRVLKQSAKSLEETTKSNEESGRSRSEQIRSEQTRTQISDPSDPHPDLEIGGREDGKVRTEDIEAVFDAHDFGLRTLREIQGTTHRQHSRNGSTEAAKKRRKLVTEAVRTYGVDRARVTARNLVLSDFHRGQHAKNSNREYLSIKYAFGEQFEEMEALYDGPDDSFPDVLKRKVLAAEQKMSMGGSTPGNIFAPHDETERPSRKVQ